MWQSSLLCSVIVVWFCILVISFGYYFTIHRCCSTNVISESRLGNRQTIWNSSWTGRAGYQETSFGLQKHPANTSRSGKKSPFDSGYQETNVSLSTKQPASSWTGRAGYQETSFGPQKQPANTSRSGKKSPFDSGYQETNVSLSTKTTSNVERPTKTPNTQSFCGQAAKRPSGQAVMRQRAALCVTGGFRTYIKTYKSQWQNLVTVFSDVDVFFMISLEDTYKRHSGIYKNHSRKELATVRDKMQPVAIREYTEAEAKRQQQGEKCYYAATFTFQFWTIKECFRMIWEHEERSKFRYSWVIRTRPDIVVTPKTRQRIQNSVLQISSPGAKVAWRYSGPTSDLLIIMTRAAAVPLGHIHESFFNKSDCGLGIHSSTFDVEKLCKPAFPKSQTYAPSPVCLVYLAWKRSGVCVVFDDNIKGELIRR
eukprot:TRINITY_DN13405_c0_g1_i1.p1 TRINITY_DN13405_c0_g1~~TRINITY_DN13405_c0_g1_i1.p1  ORF type:complete len:424 (+),score=18.74 TRINITY_DN13405_c0_g1_i1:77-1348(+)